MFIAGTWLSSKGGRVAIYIYHAQRNQVGKLSGGGAFLLDYLQSPLLCQEWCINHVDMSIRDRLKQPFDECGLQWAQIIGGDVTAAGKLNLIQWARLQLRVQAPHLFHQTHIGLK